MLIIVSTMGIFEEVPENIKEMINGWGMRNNFGRGIGRFLSAEQMAIHAIGMALLHGALTILRRKT
jgi:hypothetical protein